MTGYNPLSMSARLTRSLAQAVNNNAKCSYFSQFPYAISSEAERAFSGAKRNASNNKRLSLHINTIQAD